MRCKSVACLIFAVLLMGGSAKAGKWVAAIADPNLPIEGAADWNVAGNWDTNLVPVSGEKVQFSATAAVGALITSAAETGQLVIGDGGSNPLQQITIYNGGSLNTYGSGTWAAAGYNRPGAITVERGGALITEHRVGVGLVASGIPENPSYLNVNGGLVDITGNLQISPVGGHTGIVTVNSGILKATGWEWGPSPGTLSFMDIHHGTVEIGADVFAAIPDLITAGALTGFGGAGTVTAAFANGVTTITANDPLLRTPKMDAIVGIGDVDLSWVNVGTSPVYVAVYFGTDPENLTMIKDPNVAGSIDLTSTTVTAPSNGEYIWRVDTYDSAPGVDPNDPLVGDTMYFVASDDAPPSIVMNTSPTATWKNEPTTLQATVYDDGKSDVTVTWSAVDTSGADAGPMDPNVVFDPPFTVIPAQAPYVGTGIVVTTTMTVDYHAAQMTATATAEDSNPLLETDSASVGLDCANSACQAATAILNLDEVYLGDIAVDCMVNLTDFAVMAREWLTDYALTGPAPLPQE